MSFDINSVPGFTGQGFHFASGIAICLMLALFIPAPYAVTIAFILTFLKEAFEALGIAFWEPKQTWHDSLTDFKWFSFGITLAAILLIIKHL